MLTLAPWERKRIAIARPMPVNPPVMARTWSGRRGGIEVIFCVLMLRLCSTSWCSE